jgi:hypothetical protein
VTFISPYFQGRRLSEKKSLVDFVEILLRANDQRPVFKPKLRVPPERFNFLPSTGLHVSVCHCGNLFLWQTAALSGFEGWYSVVLHKCSLRMAHYGRIGNPITVENHVLITTSQSVPP